MLRTELEFEGSVLAVTDARGNEVMATAYDMAGRPITTSSPDSGDRVLFADIAGQPHYSWDSRDHRLRIACDELRRPAQVYLLEKGPAETWANTTATEVLIEETIFGDDSSNAPANPESKNLLGRPYLQRDGSGETELSEYDFKGNLLSSTQTLAQDYKNVLDWSGTVTLETESFETSMTYDALNRVLTQVAPDYLDDTSNPPKYSTTTNTYNIAGFLETVSVDVWDCGTPTTFISAIKTRDSHLLFVKYT